MLINFSKYADGSGKWSANVGPFRTREEARTFLREIGRCPDCGDRLDHSKCNPTDLVADHTNAKDPTCPACAVGKCPVAEYVVEDAIEAADKARKN